MEILNRNQRQNAIWRIAGIFTATIIVLGLLLFTTYRAYASQGITEAEKLKSTHERNKRDWEGNKQGFLSKIKNLKKELKQCEENTSSKALEACKKMLKKKETELDGLKDELKICTKELATINSY